MSTVLTGRIIKTYNGYYYVETEAKETYTCKVKGKLKKDRFSLATGDWVQFELGGTESMIQAILPRKNYLLRPFIANLDLVVVVFACASPEPSLLMLDKILALAEQAQIPAVLCFNKKELAPAGFIEQLQATYGTIGYPLYFISALQGEGMEALRQEVAGKVAVLAGPSGVGKSTTLNALDMGLVLETGEVSDKTQRGRHTTKYSQLLPFLGGYVADTPGFSNLNFEEVELQEPRACFRELRAYEGCCRYHGCTHTHEPGCAVKAALAEGKLAASRYASYEAILAEVKLRKERNDRR